MNQENSKPLEAEQPKEEEVPVEEITPEEVEPEEIPTEEAGDACEEVEKKVADLQQQLDKEKKEYLFLMAEFDNFRKRTLK